MNHSNIPLLMITSKALCNMRENSLTIKKNPSYLKIIKNKKRQNIHNG